MTQGYGTSARAVGGYAPSLVDRRATFIVRTYNHLFVALLAFAALEGALFAAGLAAPIAGVLGRNWWLALGGFVAASWLGSHWAHTARSRTAQYAGLAAMVVAVAGALALAEQGRDGDGADDADDGEHQQQFDEGEALLALHG